MPAANQPEPSLVDGLPSAHLIHAACEAARQLDAWGNTVAAARHSYLRYPSGGIYPSGDLEQGEALLIAAGFLRREHGSLVPQPGIRTLAAVDDEIAHEALLAQWITTQPPSWLFAQPPSVPQQADEVLQELLPNRDRREGFLIAMSRRSEPQHLAAMGAVGERQVVEAAQAELIGLDRDDLADRVRQVSTLSDQLGYDVVAPRLDGGSRRLEVKTSARGDEGLARFYLSRNEAEVGMRDPAWALVYCRYVDEDRAEIVAWCRAPTLAPYLPADGAGSRWIVADVTVPLSVLIDGMPGAV